MALKYISDILHDKSNHKEMLTYKVDDSGVIHDVQYYISTKIDYTLTGRLSFDAESLISCPIITTDYIIGYDDSYAYFNGFPALISRDSNVTVNLPNRERLNLSAAIKMMKGNLVIDSIADNAINSNHSNRIAELYPDQFIQYPTGVFLEGEGLESYHYNSFFVSLSNMAKRGFYLDQLRYHYPGCDDVVCKLDVDLK